MKKKVVVLLFATILAMPGVYAQNGTKAPAAKTVQAATETIDLSAIEIAATMKAPKGFEAIAGPYDNSIKGPDGYEISIEDAEINIAAQRKKTEGDDLTKFIKYVATDPNGFMYEAEIMGKKVVHFEYIVTIGGKSYRMYDKRVAPLTKEQVQPMYDAVKSITAK